MAINIIPEIQCALFINPCRNIGDRYRYRLFQRHPFSDTAFIAAAITSLGRKNAMRI